MTEPIEDSRPPEPSEGARMSGTPARIALSAIAVVAVAAISVVLTLLVSDTDGPRTYTQAEVDAQLAAVRSAQPSPSPSPSPHAPGAEQIVVTDEGTFVGRCVNGQPLLDRWTLNAGYKLPEPSVFDDARRTVVIRALDPSRTPEPSPAGRVKAPYRWGWMAPGGWFSTGLLVEKSQNEFVWESFICREGVFAGGPVGFRYTLEIVDKK
ncbi:hypothetical protein Rhe02_07450 [Rhizocola hellebori]|uniref:Uncharacterized protein n=1 Tax=Rhizocola hellebori TaxID=1392758 RepID=A0A8J3Q3H7_9ACTN|nr:hypothetical protein [Rhizocola hellebori]GIH02678.1 hypothetical protein Rhe02_07450 [Rhizocola hellebori]